MKVRLRSIPPVGGLDVDFTIDSALMQKNRAHGEDDVTEAFEKSVTCKLHLELSGKDVYLSGGAQTVIHPVCARCGESFDFPRRVDTFLTCSPQPPAKGKKANGDSYEESEEGLVFFKNEELDLDEIIREQMLLAVPMRFLCRENCQGLCVNCGANLNQGLHICKVAARK
jgi:uncharacterized protein